MKRSKLTALALVGILIFFTVSFSGCTDEEEGGVEEGTEAAKFIGEWEVDANRTDQVMLPYDPPPDPEEVQILYKFHDDKTLSIEMDGETIMEKEKWEIDEENSTWVIETQTQEYDYSFSEEGEELTLSYSGKDLVLEKISG
ncbi:MAG: hypothetical protein V5A88_09445 [Candidatus Thermoplasmatota archaeon]